MQCKALEDIIYLGIKRAGMKHFLGDTHLLFILFARIGVVTVHDERGILKLTLCIFNTKMLDVLIMIVW